MGPLVVKKPRDTPQNRQRLDGPCWFGLTHVGGLPSKLIKDGGDHFPRLFIVTRNKHRRLSSGQFRIDHEAAERLDKVSIGHCLLTRHGFPSQLHSRA